MKISAACFAHDFWEIKINIKITSDDFQYLHFNIFKWRAENNQYTVQYFNWRCVRVRFEVWCDKQSFKSVWLKCHQYSILKCEDQWLMHVPIRYYVTQCGHTKKNSCKHWHKICVFFIMSKNPYRALLHVQIILDTVVLLVSVRLLTFFVVLYFTVQMSQKCSASQQCRETK